MVVLLPWFLVLFLFGNCCNGIKTTTTTATATATTATTTTTYKQEIVSISYSDLQSYFEANGRAAATTTTTNDNDNNGDASPDETSSMTTQPQQQQPPSVLPPPPAHLLKAMEEAFGATTKSSSLSSKSKSSTITSLGFLEVTDIPSEMVQLRDRVLTLAHELAHLPKDQLQPLERPDTLYTFGWSRGKEEFRPGIPDTGKGSFYFNPFPTTTTTTTGIINSTSQKNEEEKVTSRNNGESKKNNSHPNNVFPKEALPDLEEALMEMTHFMAKVGLWIAQLMDAYLQQQQEENINENYSIYKSLKTCETAKARLLYYYPSREQQEQSPASCVANDNGNDNNNKDDKNGDNDDDDNKTWWCGWHKDHGSLTALLPGKLIAADNNNNINNNNNNVVVDSQAGLYIETPMGRTPITLPPTSLGFQLGETIQLMSRGKLRATPHAVKAPAYTYTQNTNNNNIGRSSLALFLQPPAWQELPPIITEGNDDDDTHVDESLRTRWRPTFGEFQQATTRAFQ